MNSAPGPPYGNDTCLVRSSRAMAPLDYWGLVVRCRVGSSRARWPSPPIVHSADWPNVRPVSHCSGSDGEREGSGNRCHCARKIRSDRTSDTRLTLVRTYRCC